LFFNNTTAETANSRIIDIPIKLLKASISINPSALFVSPISKKLCRIITVGIAATAKHCVGLKNISFGAKFSLPFAV